MNKHIEKEYKMLLTKNEYLTLRALYPNAISIPQTNTYYDTVAQTLKKQQCALRIREKNGTFLLTLKHRKGKNLYEHESKIDQNRPEVFLKTDIQKLLEQFHVTTQLKPIANFITHRTSIDFEHAQLCIDFNQFAHYEDYEVEYEYKLEHDGRKIFKSILAKANIHFSPNDQPKIARALKKCA